MTLPARFTRPSSPSLVEAYLQPAYAWLLALYFWRLISTDAELGVVAAAEVTALEPNKAAII